MLQELVLGIKVFWVRAILSPGYPAHRTRRMHWTLMAAGLALVLVGGIAIETQPLSGIIAGLGMVLGYGGILLMGASYQISRGEWLRAGKPCAGCGHPLPQSERPSAGTLAEAKAVQDTMTAAKLEWKEEQERVKAHASHA